MPTRSLKLTVRVNTRDDADLVEHLQGRNVSKAFKDALRAQVRKDTSLDVRIREEVVRCVRDLLSETGALGQGWDLSQKRVCSASGKPRTNNRLW